MNAEEFMNLVEELIEKYERESHTIVEHIWLERSALKVYNTGESAYKTVVSGVDLKR